MLKKNNLIIFICILWILQNKVINSKRLSENLQEKEITLNNYEIFVNNKKFIDNSFKSNSDNAYLVKHLNNFTKSKQNTENLLSQEIIADSKENQKNKFTDFTKYLYNLIGFKSIASLFSVRNIRPKSATAVPISELELFEQVLQDEYKASTRTAVVFPGTIWCGIGNKALTENTIGIFQNTDVCCRNHDLCEEQMDPGQMKHGLINNGYFTRSHCDCDRDFYYCLKSTNTYIATKIGYLYFNLFKPQCFREEFPIIQCVEMHKKRCASYIVDDTKPKEWQWFDNRVF